MQFDLSDYKSPRYVMVCQTKAEVDEFSEVLNNAGRKWASGNKYTELHYYNDIPEGGCAFIFNCGVRCGKTLQSLNNIGYHIMYWRDFTASVDVPMKIKFDELFKKRVKNG